MSTYHSSTCCVDISRLRRVWFNWLSDEDMWRISHKGFHLSDRDKRTQKWQFQDSASVYFTINFLEVLLTLYSCLAGHKRTGEFWGRAAGPPAEQNCQKHPQRLPGCQLARWDIKSEACSPVLGFVFSFLTGLFVLVFPSCFLLYRRSRHQVSEADVPPGEQGGGPDISHQHGWNVWHLKVPTRLPAFTICLACLHVDSSAAAGCTSVYCPAVSLRQNSWQSPWRWRTVAVRKAETLSRTIQTAPSLKVLFLPSKELLV